MFRRPFAALSLLVTAFAVVACGGPSGPEGGVAGNWSVNGTDDATNCGEGVTSFSVNVRIEQSGNTLTVTISGEEYTGTLSGSQGTWSGSYPDDGGTTAEQYTVTFANNNTTLTGGSTWSWTDGVTSCTGSTQVTGSK